MANVATLGVAKQSAFGTKNTTLTPIKVTSINSSDLDISRIENDEIFGGINTFAPSQGLRSAAVGVAGRAYPNALGYFLNMISGAPVTVDNTGDYTHTFTPADVLPPRYTIGFDEPNGIDAHFVDVLASSFGLTQEVGNVLMFNFDGIASNRVVEAVTVPSAGVEDRPFRFNDFTATIDTGGGAAAVVNFKSVNISIDNPVENIYALDGSDSAITQEYTGRRSVSVDGTMRFVDDAASFRAEFEANTSMDLVFTWTIDAATSLVVTIPDFRMESHNWNRGFDETEVDFAGGAFQDAVAGNAITFALTNTTTTY